MSLLAAAVVPSAPLLVPALAGGSASVDDGLRGEVFATTAWLAGQDGGDLVVVGAADTTGCVSGSWDWSGFGGGAAPASRARLPLALGIGAWLLEQVGAPAASTIGVAQDADPASCVELGRRLVAQRDVRLLVVGDGSACRTDKAPGHLDPRAASFDAHVEQALSAAEPERLRALEPGLAAELLASGRAAWQVLAGAAADRSWHGEVRRAEAPYGVAYFVARWQPDGSQE